MKTIIRWAKAGALLLVVIVFWIVLRVGAIFAVLAAVLYAAWLYLLWNRIRSLRVAVEGNMLIQTDGAGSPIAQINLDEPYKVDVSFKSFLKAIYTIKQSGSKVQFTSEADNARHIAVDVLRVSKEWPPVGPWNFGW
jgi:hypothetical protein